MIRALLPRAFRIFSIGCACALSILADGAVVQPPAYTAAGIVSAASYSADALAPNAIVALFGSNLSYNTASLTADDLSNAAIPTSLGGVTVYVDGVAAALFYVSPLQINFLIPNSFTPSSVEITVIREGIAGPKITVTLHAAGPALFQDANYNAIATHLDGSLVSSDAPAHGGDWVVLYGAGLGRTIPDASNYSPATGIAPIADVSDFAVLLDGTNADWVAGSYAGLAPGYAGLYQINVKLPADTHNNPEIQLSAGGAISVTGIHLQVN